jgi:hypothetical protein
LYHPHQDPGDNLDLITPYALPEIDLKAVILDVTQRYRRPYRDPAHPSYDDPVGGRDPGFIPVTQLNYLFGRNVPCAVGPFEAMRAPDDPMRDAPRFQQTGVELLLETLRASAEPVHILSFGSARPVAVALNREPQLMREKVRRVHLCAGAAPAGFVEWNVQLDVHAFVRVLRSDLPVALYPCGTDKGAFDLGVNNTYWKLPDLQFVRKLHPKLQRYLAFAFERSTRMDFLCAMDDDVTADVLDRIGARVHHVWETAVWAAASGRQLVRRGDGTHRLVPAHALDAGDSVLSSELRPVRLKVADDGQFTFESTDGPSNVHLYYRKDPVENERALCEALPALYLGFDPDAKCA